MADLTGFKSHVNMRHAVIVLFLGYSWPNPTAIAQYHERATTMLSADLIPHIQAGGEDFLIIRIDGVTYLQNPQQGRESGTLNCTVERVMRSDLYKAGGRIEVPFDRDLDPGARDKNTVNQWNNLPLEKGTQLVVALAPDSGSRAMAHAAIVVDDTSEATITELENAIEIESLEDPELQHPRLQESLIESTDLQRGYALDFLGRRGFVPPVEAIAMVSTAIESDKVPEPEKLNLARVLIERPFFDRARKADPANAAVVAVLARNAFREKDPDRLNSWMRFLGSRIRGSFDTDTDLDMTIKLDLVNRASHDIPAGFDTFLRNQAVSGSVDQRPAAVELLNLWESAQHIKK